MRDRTYEELLASHERLLSLVDVAVQLVDEHAVIHAMMSSWAEQAREAIAQAKGETR